MKKIKNGFTLIELLVVVLIIGILAAVALPQYQRAVEKSRMVEAFIVGKNLKEREELYRIEHGNYTDNFEELGDIPSGYKVLNDGKQINKGPFVITLLNNIDRVLIWYSYNNSQSMSLSFKLDSLGGKRHCCAYAKDNYHSTSLCKNLGGHGDGDPACEVNGESGCLCWNL